MTQLKCPVCSEVIVDTVDDFEEALVPIIMHHAIKEEREKIAKNIEKFAQDSYTGAASATTADMLAISEYINTALEHAVEIVRGNA